MTERAQEFCCQAAEILTSRMARGPAEFFRAVCSSGCRFPRRWPTIRPCSPLDEVTTGLDYVGAGQGAGSDSRKIKARYGISILLVSHDLAVIRMLADRTVVMLDGKIMVESGLTDQVLEDPQHAYTQQLVHSLL